MSRTLCILALTLLLPVAATAATVDVPGDQATIQAGINAAVAGDTVLVACGTYHEYNITMKSGVILRSETGLPDCVTIDAQQLGRVVYCSGMNSSTRIEGFTLRGGYYSTGAGIFCTNSPVRVSHCVIRNNTASSSGGGFYCNNNQPVLTDCEIRDNTASSYGGGIHCATGLPQLTDCVIRGNTAGGSGGGISIASNCSATGSFTRCTLADNTASSSGSGLFKGSTTGNLILDACTFLHNVGTNDLAYSSASTLSCGSSAPITMTHCSFGHNEGYAIYTYSPLVGDHTIIAFNALRAVYGDGAGTVTLSCSDVFGNGGGDWVDVLAGQGGSNGNFSADPLFCDPHAGHLQLAAGSPCLDAPGCGQVGAQGQGCDTPVMEVWEVPLEAPTIRAGIDSAWVGDTVSVATGSFLLSGGYVYVKPGIVMHSASGVADSTTIDCGGNSPFWPGPGVTIRGLTITNPSQGRGIEMFNSGYGRPVTIEECVISASDVGIDVSNADAEVVVRGCTIAYNDTGISIGYSTSPDVLYSIENTIVAFNGYSGVYRPGGTNVPQLTCTDVYGNGDGDWVGCIAGQEGSNGNLSADPLFCEGPRGNLWLAGTSPCLGPPGCGQLGALGQGCDEPLPPRLWHVPSDAPTIQAAIDSTVQGDTVVVACGVYHELDIAPRSGIGIRSETGDAECVVIDPQQLGRGFNCSYIHDVTIRGITIRNGMASNGGAMYSEGAVDVVVDDCAFVWSRARYGGAVYTANNSSVTLSNCTIAFNAASKEGGAVCTTTDGSTTLDHSVAAWNLDGATVSSYGTTVLNCCDLYGNVGGDWVGAVAGQYGSNGNISLDPMFCDMPDDLRLAADSPCLDTAGCGVMGAWGQGCDEPVPPVVWHVPQDCPTIQAGVDSAALGDTVVVACGTYTWAGEGTGDGQGLIRLKEGIVLRSETGLADCVTLDGQSQGRVLYCYALSALTQIRGFTITGGTTTSYPYQGGGLLCTYDTATEVDCNVGISDCRFIGNTGTYGAGAALVRSTSLLTRCEFTANIPHSGAGAGVYVLGDTYYPTTAPGPTFDGCLFLANGFLGSGSGAAAWISSYNVAFTHCFFHGNTSGTGTLYIDYAPGTTLDHTVFAFNQVAAAAPYSGTVTLSCCDVYGNVGGDYIGPFSGQSGLRGNISSDPMFCDPANGDFTLARESPCLASCGTMGPFGQGACGWYETLVEDIAPDQGGQVRVSWERFYHDAQGTDVTITSYALWRRIDDLLLKLNPGAVEEGQQEIAALLLNGDPPEGEWDCVATIPAWGDDQYHVVSPTLCDSTVSQGACWSVFFVSAHTSDPFVYYVTPPDSGYSVDNLAPGVPENFRLAEPAVLAWDASADEDFDYFTVYGSALDHLDESAEVLGYTTETSLGVAGENHAYYHLTATDFAGNEGDEATVQDASGTGETPAVPRAFALHPGRPNPACGMTAIRFDLPETAEVWLRVLDPTGRVVATLVRAELRAGSYEIPWRGRDDRGATVGAGVYFYRLDAGRFTKTQKLLLAK